MKENRKNAGGIKNIGCLIVLLAVGFVGYMIFTSVKDTMPTEEQLEKSREQAKVMTEAIIKNKIPASIVDMDEIDWVEYDDEVVYIGFNKRPDDLKTMIDMWAIQANRELGSMVSVWAVVGEEKGWRPGNSASVNGYHAIARNGKTQ
jgi:hypothetical protein